MIRLIPTQVNQRKVLLRIPLELRKTRPTHKPRFFLKSRHIADVILETMSDTTAKTYDSPIWDLWRLVVATDGTWQADLESQQEGLHRVSAAKGPVIDSIVTAVKLTVG